MNRTLWLLSIFVGFCVVVGFYVSRKPPTEPASSVPPADSDDASRVSGLEKPQEVTVVPAVSKRPAEVLAGGYSSASSCTRCHETQHKSWHASFHRSMTQKVSPESAPDAIDNQLVSVAGEDYEFVREGDRYFVNFNDPVEPGSGTVKKELVLMTGSHHMSVFWYESPFDRTPAMLPVVYLLDQQRWIPRNSAFVRPPGEPGHELGRWNQVCSRCHSTHPRGRLNKQTDAWDTHVVDFGIACESCHGPGEGHIRFHDKLDSSLQSDDVVITPEDLPHDLQSDVCGQCHSVYVPNFDEYDQDEFHLTGMPYRPGDDLEDSPLRTLVRLTPEAEGTRGFERAKQEENLHHSFWSDGTVRVAGREYTAMVESPCFQNGKMSCLSCHQMHPDDSVDLNVWRSDQLKPEMKTDHACTQCHREPKYNRDLTQHTHHASDSHGSRCMNCHMPHSTYGLLKSIRSHRIESPSVITTLDTGRPNGCVLCHLDRSIGWAGEHLTQWYGQQAVELKNPIARDTASGLVNLLLGDAGLRAIYASAFAWEPAREVSGTDWMAPYLMIGMIDDYDAIRLITKRTLQTLPGYENVDIDEFAGIKERAGMVNRYLAEFKRDVRLKPRLELLIDEDGKIDFDRASALFNARDQTPIFLQE